MIILCLLFMSLFLVACEKEKKQGKLSIAEQTFHMRQDTENTFTIDAKGKIRNIGDVDVKNVVVTGYCRSCPGLWGVGQWQTSPDLERMPQQKDTINYIAAGGEESFSFTEVADYLLTADRKTPELPEKLEAVIESFETVE
ncbi:MAG: hypothetical protein C4518_10015 [Desulfobacteraceae bacterium]|nr:MAG: hypothetical protein C4518_10015 [Desulfobacteraceae bacterium]